MGMSTTLMPDHRERLRGAAVMSLLLHLLLLVVAITYQLAGPRFGRGWGRGWGGGGAVRVNAVAALPGVPLPGPMITTQNIVATQNPGLYQTPKVTPPAPAPDKTDIPKFKQAVPTEKTLRVAKRLQKEPQEMPDNAIPFGLGGKPTMSYMPLVNAAGEGGLSFGDGNFGDRYGWYVAAVRNRISSNWLLSTVSSSVQTAPRVYVNFDILRDGTITNVVVTESSGNSEVDRSALRAVLASNPLNPLPPDYPGNKVSVDFYFDFRRR